VTIGQVNEFYQRADLDVATGDEEPCTGCDQKVEPKEEYSIYALRVSPPPIKGLPETIVLCKACTYLVIGSRMA
jgi:hypothetical protein